MVVVFLKICYIIFFTKGGGNMTTEMYRAGIAEIDNIYLEYYVVGKNKINKNSGYFEWGIKVVKFASGIKEESEEIENISPDYNKVLKIAEILLRNKVTPVGVRYALEDLLC